MKITNAFVLFVALLLVGCGAKISPKAERDTAKHTSFRHPVVAQKNGIEKVVYFPAVMPDHLVKGEHLYGLYPVICSHNGKIIEGFVRYAELDDHVRAVGSVEFWQEIDQRKDKMIVLNRGRSYVFPLRTDKVLPEFDAKIIDDENKTTDVLRFIDEHGNTAEEIVASLNQAQSFQHDYRFTVYTVGSAEWVAMVKSFNEHLGKQYYAHNDDGEARVSFLDREAYKDNARQPADYDVSMRWKKKTSVSAGSLVASFTSWPVAILVGADNLKNGIIAANEDITTTSLEAVVNRKMMVDQQAAFMELVRKRVDALNRTIVNRNLTPPVTSWRSK